MAKVKTAFFCKHCGAHYSKWQGQCHACKEWNTIIEEVLHKPKNEANDFHSRAMLLFWAMLDHNRALNSQDVSWIRTKGFWAYRHRKTFCQLVVSSCRWSCFPGTLLEPFWASWRPLAQGPLLGLPVPPWAPSWAALGGSFGPLGRIFPTFNGTLQNPLFF